MMKRIPLFIIFLLFIAPLFSQSAYNFSKLQREKLGRGVIAIRESPSSVFVIWRYLSSDPMEVALYVYRDGKRITDTPVAGGTFSVMHIREIKL